MKNWIFIVKAQGNVEAKTIYATLMKEGEWGLGEKTPRRTRIEPDDRVVFYLGSPMMQFAGTARTTSKAIPRSAEQKRHLREEVKIPDVSDYMVSLSDIETWIVPKDAKTIVPSLEFIGKKDAWGVYLQGGVREVSDADYARIVAAAGAPGAAGV